LFVGITAALTLVFVAGGGQTAQGHDYLGSTAPAGGATIEDPLSRVSLTFSEPPLEGLGTGSYISVVSADGEAVSDDNVIIEGATLSVPVTFATPGVYTVTWQTVSSDGHPISGSYSFTWLSNGVTESVTPSPSAASTSPNGTAITEPSGFPTPVSTQEQGTENSVLPWLVVLVVVLALGVVYLIVRMRRRMTNSLEEKP
jgi:methionine-rich copper-binding protein CopC